jgi:hypothetical protein
MNKASFDLVKSPAKTGLFIVWMFLLSACETPKTPEQVTAAFWQAMTEKDEETAIQFVTTDSQALVSTDTHELPENASVETGRIVIENQHASVETFIVPQDANHLPQSFYTELQKEGETWKVDFRKTVSAIPGYALGHLFKGLKDIGENLNKQLEEQMPLFEKEIESYGRELEKQMQEFEKKLEKLFPPSPPKGNPDSI